MLWPKLSPLSSPSGSPPAARVSCGGAGAPLAGAQRRDASHTPYPAKEGRERPDAPSPDVDVPAPRAGGGEASLGDSTVRAPCGEVDAPQGKRAGKGSPTYVQCA
jgi:hypothetical protein